MRGMVLSMGVAVAGLFPSSAPAQHCRCGNARPSPSVSPAAGPQDRVFWDAPSGRYLFYAGGSRTWYSWQPGAGQWQAVAPSEWPRLPSPAAPADRQSHDHARGALPAPVPQPAPTAQAPYGGQRTCPVTDEELGAHGMPIPVTVKGRTVYVCCRGCVAKVQRDPDTYLAKVAEERARLGTGTPGR